MYLSLHIDADPIQWMVSGDDPTSMAAEITATTGPLVMPVFTPVRGRLILSPHTAHSIVISPPIHGPGWIPSDSKEPNAYLYVPGAPAANATIPGYPLPPNTEVQQCEVDIINAMHAGTQLSIHTIDSIRNAVVVLNAATLPFVVLFPPAPQP